MNIEKEMQREIKTESDYYIAYGKMSLYTLLNSATTVTKKQLVAEIDVMRKLYGEAEIITKANKLT